MKTMMTALVAMATLSASANEPGKLTVNKLGEKNNYTYVELRFDAEQANTGRIEITDSRGELLYEERVANNYSRVMKFRNDELEQVNITLRVNGRMVENHIVSTVTERPAMLEIVELTSDGSGTRFELRMNGKDGQARHIEIVDQKGDILFEETAKGAYNRVVKVADHKLDQIQLIVFENGYPIERHSFAKQ